MPYWSGTLPFFLCRSAKINSTLRHGFGCRSILKNLLCLSKHENFYSTRTKAVTKKRSKIKHEMCNNVVVKTAKYKEENHLESIEFYFIFDINK